MVIEIYAAEGFVMKVGDMHEIMCSKAVFG